MLTCKFLLFTAILLLLITVAMKAPRALTIPPSINSGGFVRPDSQPSSLGQHPRLFFSSGDEDAIMLKSKTIPLLARLIDVLKHEADITLLKLPQNYIPDAQLLNISREEIKRIVTLSMAFRLFKEEKYAKKAEEEILNVCSFPSWHPEHFLDVAEMTTAVAIGYDWCYQYLSPATRKAVEDAINIKAFAPAWPIYAITDKKTPFNRENNWNMVCNAGMVTGALAIGDKYPAEAKRIIDYAVKYTPNLLNSFAPEGVFNEGPGYWSYNGMYMALLFDNLERNIHNTFGLPEFKGLNNTARFYMNIIGPHNDTYNFGDASDNVDLSGTFFYLSRKYHQPKVAEFYRNLIKSALHDYTFRGDFEFPRFFFLAIPWFDDSKPTSADENNKFNTFKGVTDFIIMNGGNTSDSNRLYLAAKTGRPSWSHNQLDVGSFIVECDGVRWGVDLGADSYSLPDFWDYKPGGVRWNYFRNTNMAHNTLSIDNKITNSDGQGELIRQNKNIDQPYGIFDMTSSYKGQADSVLRGFKWVNTRSILIRDEVRVLPGSKKLCWRFFTKANVQLDGNLATLSQGGKKFYIRCLLKDGFTMQAVRPTTNSNAEKPLSGITSLEIVMDGLENKSISVPVLIGSRLDEPKGIADLKLSKW